MPCGRNAVTGGVVVCLYGYKVRRFGARENGFRIAGHVHVPDWRPDQRKDPCRADGAPPVSIIVETLLNLQIS
jgi:hypothetical protein